MAKLRTLGRHGAGLVGTVAFLWELWTRIPAKQRKQLLAQARKHGPALVKSHGPKAAKRLASRRGRS
ncbi:MAG: hypothetical protein WCH31_07395 [Actinomycetes bacterium]